MFENANAMWKSIVWKGSVYLCVLLFQYKYKSLVWKVRSHKNITDSPNEKCTDLSTILPVILFQIHSFVQTTNSLNAEIDKNNNKIVKATEKNTLIILKLFM